MSSLSTSSLSLFPYYPSSLYSEFPLTLLLDTRTYGRKCPTAVSLVVVSREMLHHFLCVVFAPNDLTPFVTPTIITCSLVNTFPNNLTLPPHLPSSIMHSAFLSTLHRSLALPRSSFISSLHVAVSYDAHGLRRERLTVEIAGGGHYHSTLPPSPSSPTLLHSLSPGASISLLHPHPDPHHSASGFSTSLSEASTVYCATHLSPSPFARCRHGDLPSLTSHPLVTLTSATTLSLFPLPTFHTTHSPSPLHFFILCLLPLGRLLTAFYPPLLPCHRHHPHHHFPSPCSPFLLLLSLSPPPHHSHHHSSMRRHECRVRCA